MPSIVRDGVGLAYDDTGSGDPALVFVHGWCCDRSAFAPQVEHFASRHRCVAVDLRGHGTSDSPGGAYPLATFADDTAVLVEELGLDRPVVVGHSLGGAVALQLAVDHPEAVRAVVLVDPAPLRPRPRQRAALEAMVAAVESGDDASRRSFIERALFLPISPPALRQRVTDGMASVPAGVAAAAMRGVLAWDGEAVGGRCSVPVLHVAADPPVNPPHVFSEVVPHAVTGWTVGAGHFNQLEAPDQVNSMIQAFLEHYVA